MIAETRVRDATIANGASISGTLQCAEQLLVGVYMPAAWTAGGLALEISRDGTTWLPAYNVGGGTVYALTVDASRYIPVDRAVTKGALYLRLRSGTSAVPVNQGAARIVGLAFIPDVSA